MLAEPTHDAVEAFNWSTSLATGVDGATGTGNVCAQVTPDGGNLAAGTRDGGTCSDGCCRTQTRAG